MPAGAKATIPPSDQTSTGKTSPLPSADKAPSAESPLVPTSEQTSTEKSMPLPSSDQTSIPESTPLPTSEHTVKPTMIPSSDQISTVTSPKASSDRNSSATPAIPTTDNLQSPETDSTLDETNKISKLTKEVQEPPADPPMLVRPEVQELTQSQAGANHSAGKDGIELEPSAKQLQNGSVVEPTEEAIAPVAAVTGPDPPVASDEVIPVIEDASQHEEQERKRRGRPKGRFFSLNKSGLTISPNGFCIFSNPFIVYLNS